MRGRPEAILEREILRCFGQRPDLLLCKNEVGAGFTRGVMNEVLSVIPADLLSIVRQIFKKHAISFGLGVGSPDLIGFLEGNQVILAELKSEDGELRETQVVWRDAAARRGIAVDVIRSEGEMNIAIERARARARR